MEQAFPVDYLSRLNWLYPDWFRHYDLSVRPWAQNRAILMVFRRLLRETATPCARHIEPFGPTPGLTVCSRVPRARLAGSKHGVSIMWRKQA